MGEPGRSTTAAPHANAAASKVLPAANAGLNSLGVVSIIGAFLLGGGTLSASPQVVGASPFDPRPPPKSSRQPFFEGWFIRWGQGVFWVAPPACSQQYRIMSCAVHVHGLR